MLRSGADLFGQGGCRIPWPKPIMAGSGDRAGQFINVDRTVVQPYRTLGGYRRFTQRMLVDIAMCCYRNGWFSMDTLEQVLCQMFVVAGGMANRDEPTSVRSQSAVELSAAFRNRHS